MRMTLRLGEHRQELRVLHSGEGLRVTLADGRELRARVQRHDDGSFTVEREGRRLECAGAVRGPERQLWLDGRTLAYRRDDGARPGETRAEPGSMASSIPAVVREVLVAPGEQVVEGQKLILLESMKMVLPVLASRAGRVRAIVCVAGDAVSPGLPLVELDEV